jgi:ATP-binding cassette subfamily B protein RaxB
MDSTKKPSLSFWKRRATPMILQTEAAECGLACVAMIASYWGYRVDLRLIRRKYPISLKGSTLKSIMSIASNLNFRCRPIKVDLRKLSGVRLPSILHWDMNHFVVLTRVKSTSIVINDPAVGERSIPLLEAGKHFTGVALELTPGADFVTRDETQRIRISELIGRVSGLFRGGVVLACLGLGIQTCMTIMPFFIQWIVDQVLVGRDRNLLVVLAIGFSFVAIIQALFGGLRTWYTASLAADLNFQWLGNVFSHLMRLPLSFFERRHLGDIVSRFNAVQMIQKSITTQAVDAVLDGILSGVILGVMCFYSIPLTFISLGSLTIYAILRAIVYQPLKNRNRDQIIFTAKQQTHFLESSRGVQSIKLFNRAAERQMGWENMLADQMNAELGVSKLTIIFQFANSVLFNIDRIVIVFFGARLALDNYFTVGMLIAFLGFKEQLTTRSSALVDKYFEFKMLSFGRYYLVGTGVRR